MSVRVALHTRLKPGAEAAYEAAHREVPAELPVNVAWQARMAELLERVHSYGDADAALEVVWEL